MMCVRNASMLSSADATAAAAPDSARIAATAAAASAAADAAARRCAAEAEPCIALNCSTTRLGPSGT